MDADGIGRSPWATEALRQAPPKPKERRAPEVMAKVGRWLEARATIGEERCVTCGKPRHPHNFRHPFRPSAVSNMDTWLEPTPEELREAGQWLQDASEWPRGGA